jgi:hypothetical protein|tara:strand:+ start:8446 stop:9015 length:570 start_codon:yes stop_codon:yes gene_type:complete
METQDPLDREIAEKKARYQQLKSELDTVAVELRVLERAASLRPARPIRETSVNRKKPTPAVKKARGGSGKRHSGRQPGSISESWQSVLRGMYRRGSKKASYEEIHAITERNGMGIGIASTRDRVRNMVKTGLLSGNASRGFAVTEEAIHRFGLDKGNEAPAGNARGASEAGEDATSLNENRTKVSDMFG